MHCVKLGSALYKAGIGPSFERKKLHYSSPPPHLPLPTVLEEPITFYLQMGVTFLWHVYKCSLLNTLGLFIESMQNSKFHFGVFCGHFLDLLFFFQNLGARSKFRVLWSKFRVWHPPSKVLHHVLYNEVLHGSIRELIWHPIVWWRTFNTMHYVWERRRIPFFLWRLVNRLWTDCLYLPSSSLYLHIIN